MIENNMRLKSVCTLFNDIENTTGTLNKSAMFKSYEDKEIRDILVKLALDKDINFYISGNSCLSVLKKIASKSVNSKYDYDKIDLYTQFLDLISKLQNRQITGNLAKNEVSIYLDKVYTFDENVAKWIIRVLSKNLRMGLSDKILPDIIGYKLKKYIPMLAEDSKQFTNPKITLSHEKNYILEPKIDGIRLLAVCDNDGVCRLYTRNGKEKLGLTFIKEQIESLGLKNEVLDGEIIVSGNWYDTASVVQKTVNYDENAAKNAQFMIFDIIPLNTLINEDQYDTRDPLMSRKYKLDRLYSSHYNNCPNLKTIPYVRIIEDSIENKIMFIKQTFNQYLDDGFEGVMVKEWDSKYENGRSKSWLKYKQEFTNEYKCIGVIEGNGNFVGTLGAIIIDLGNGKTCRVGGFKEEDRIKYWNNPDLILNHMVEVKYTEQSAYDDLRHPRFLRIRLDKE